MTILTKLKSLYPSLIEYHEQEKSQLLTMDYQWYLVEDETIIGIASSELKEKDKQLLATFLQPTQLNTPKRSALADRWHERIFSKTAEKPKERFRFIYFQLGQHTVDHGLIMEVFEGLFSEEVPIIWLSPWEGLLIESVDEHGEPMNYHQIIDILIADVSVPIAFFIGYFIEDYENLKQYYDLIVETGKTIFKDTNELVIDYFQSIPYLLLQHVDDAERTGLVASILQRFRSDEEMLQTLETFLQCNMNVSEAAKQLYMHRNSLQYRIDKFVGETNIHIQEFDQAFVVQLALIANKMKRGKE